MEHKNKSRLMLNTPIIIINFVILARLQVSRSTSYCFRSVPPPTEPRGRNSSCRPDVQYLCHSHPPAWDEWQTVPRAGRCRASRYWGLCSFFLPDKTVNFWSSSTRLRLSSDTVTVVERKTTWHIFSRPFPDLQHGGDTKPLILRRKFSSNRFLLAPCCPR